VTLKLRLFIQISYLVVLAACGSSGSGDQAPPNTGGGGVATLSATLSWDSPTFNNDGSAINNLSAFRVIYGNSPTNMDRILDIPNPGVSRYVVEGLSPGTYYFVVRAVNDQGVESADSNVVSKVIQ
jgi:hypothetical protein